MSFGTISKSRFHATTAPVMPFNVSSALLDGLAASYGAGGGWAGKSAPLRHSLVRLGLIF